jgi:hypothetical protein
VYEWLPWIGHFLPDVPQDKKQRETWLAKTRAVNITDDVRKSLQKWYGKEKAAQVNQAEAFEICEYGAQPGEAEIRRLFPMLSQ